MYHGAAGGSITGAGAGDSSCARPRFQVPRAAHATIKRPRITQVMVMTQAIPSTPQPVQAGTRNASGMRASEKNVKIAAARKGDLHVLLARPHPARVPGAGLDGLGRARDGLGDHHHLRDPRPLIVAWAARGTWKRGLAHELSPAPAPVIEPPAAP